MTPNGMLQVAVYAFALAGLGYPLGIHLARVYGRERTFLDRFVGPLERLVYRIAGVDPAEEMDWKGNAVAMLVFNAAGFLAVYALQRLQQFLPLNPQGLGPVSPDSAFNTSVSFVSNTNWQGYAGEATMSHLTQMLALTVQNFLSAATGLAVLALFVRGLARHSTELLGNFWVDMTRSVLYVLLPLSFPVAILLAGQGVVQTFSGPVTVAVLDTAGAGGGAAPFQSLPMGPVASQVAIKQLGTNGGGYFNANSAHPFENPTTVSNFVEMLSILLLAAAACFMFGRMIGDMRQGWAVFAAMFVLWAAFLGVCLISEQRGNPALAAAGADQAAGPLQPGGNMEGKEVRFGIVTSAIWAVSTTAASNGSVNAMHDSFTPAGGGVLLVLMQLGEVVFGGAGSGLYGMLVFAIVAVFVAGLLVGRTPEYLGHKVEAREITLAALPILIMPLVVLILTAVAVVSEAGRAGVFNRGPHGFSEVLYLFTSTGNNNGSAFAGIASNTPFYNILGGIAMVAGRYWLAVPTMALAGSLAAKKLVPVSEGTLPTHTPLFVAWLVAVVVIVGALNFIPALALGPIVEHLMVP